MANHAELDRLKSTQDLAFQRKQAAYKTQEVAWNRRSAARDALNRAHEAKQHAYGMQDASWQDYQRVRANLGSRIDQLNALQEAAFQNMKRAFDDASAAYDRRDGASARMYADQGHGHKAEAQGYVAERRRLVEEIRSARARHDAAKPAFARAKEQFSEAKRNYDRAKADHEQAQASFKRAKEAFDQAAGAFRKRLETVRSDLNRHKDDKRSVAEKAGVPFQYQNNVWVSREPNGTTNIYFGGVGAPNGPGHGHYVLDSAGSVTYRRDLFDVRGKTNFVDDEAYIRRQREQGHARGYGRPQHGYIDGRPVTFSVGWGGNEGHTLLADGHLTEDYFRESAHHNHYGPGDGPGDNAKDRGKYTGPGA